MKNREDAGNSELLLNKKTFEIESLGNLTNDLNLEKSNLDSEIKNISASVGIFPDSLKNQMSDTRSQKLNLAAYDLSFRSLYDSGNDTETENPNAQPNEHKRNGASA